MGAEHSRRSFRVFDERTEEYDMWFERNEVIYRTELKLVENFPCRPPCLEIGVGTGRFAQPLGAQFGVDPSVQSLYISKLRGIEVARGVAESLPFRDGSFSSAYLIVTLCFVDDPLQTLRESSRVLKKDGRLVACIVPLDSQWGQFYQERKRRGESVFYRDAVFYTREQLKEMLEAAGFELVRAESVLHYPPGSEIVPEDPREDEEGSFVCYESRKG